MKMLKIQKHINTLGSLRKALCAVNFICWVIVTLAGLYWVASVNEALVRFFLGPIGGAILTYTLKRVQYRAMPVKPNKEENISWDPMTYAVFILPFGLTLIFLSAVFAGVPGPVFWIPIVLLVNVGVQYAFFSVFGKSEL